MKRIILVLVAELIITAACNQSNKTSITSKTYSFKVYSIDIGHFGYDIYKDSAIMIHQPTIPGLQGNQSFVKKEDAEKVAQLMIDKLNNNIMPPSVSPTELDSLKISIN